VIKPGEKAKVLMRGPRGEFELPFTEAVFGGPAKRESRGYWIKKEVAEDVFVPHVARFGEKNRTTGEQVRKEVPPDSSLEGLLLPQSPRVLGIRVHDLIRELGVPSVRNDAGHSVLKVHEKWQLGERAWVKQILAQYDKVEERRPKLVQGVGDDWPDWVWPLWGMLMGMSHPGLNVKNAKRWTARDLGKFLGRQNALERLPRAALSTCGRAKSKFSSVAEALVRAARAYLCREPAL